MAHQIYQIFHRGRHTAQYAQAKLIVAGGRQVALFCKVIGDPQHTGIEDLNLRLDAAL